MIWVSVVDSLYSTTGIRCACFARVSQESWENRLSWLGVFLKIWHIFKKMSVSANIFFKLLMYLSFNTSLFYTWSKTCIITTFISLCFVPPSLFYLGHKVTNISKGNPFDQYQPYAMIAKVITIFSFFKHEVLRYLPQLPTTKWFHMPFSRKINIGFLPPRYCWYWNKLKLLLSLFPYLFQILFLLWHFVIWSLSLYLFLQSFSSFLNLFNKMSPPCILSIFSIKMFLIVCGSAFCIMWISINLLSRV